MFLGLTVVNLAGVPIGTYIGNHFVYALTFIIIAFIGLLTIAALYFGCQM
jgi:DHA1 family arabinose polymer transporter-like MFS transporter